MKDESRPEPAPEGALTDYAVKRRVLRRMEVKRMLSSSPPPVPWLAKPVLVRGCLSLLTGRPGEGKSMLSQALAVAVASGSSVAGIEAVKGRVLVLDGENGRHELHRRVHSLGLPKEAAERFELYEADGFHLGRHLDWLEELLDEHRPELLVLDSFRTLWPGGDENSSEEVAGVLDALRGLVRRYESSALLLHHLGKGGGAYRGSSAIAASCELAFKLDRAEGDGERERRRLACFKSRPAAEPAPRWLRLEARDGRVLVSEAEPFEGTVTVADSLQDGVLRAVTDGAARLSEIATAVGRPPKDATVRRTLSALVEDGRLERVGKEYRLPSEGARVSRAKASDTLTPATGEARTLAAIAGEEVAA
jgi:KaiC/GvpD/RAD55 family RecA-like ATPase